MSVMLALAIRSSIVLLAGLLLATLLARRSAALRHVALAASIFAAAAVVPLSFALPEWEVALPRSLQSPVTTTPVPAPAVPRDHITVAADSQAKPQQRSGHTLSLGWMVWLAGFAVTAGMLLIGILRLVRIASRAARIDDGPWASITRAVAAACGIGRGVVVLQTDVPGLLATWGLLRPRVLVPANARAWPEERVHVVLCHELAHIRRHDWIVQIIAEALLTLLWFNPLMWLACRRLRRESEQACDDDVLRRVPAHAYATHLLALARECRRPQYPWATAMPMAHPSTLERRIAAMLNPNLNRAALSRRAVALTAVLLLALTLPIAAFRAAQSGPAALIGSVYDTSGAVLPGVELTLEDARQNATKTTTDAAGRFTFTNIAPGHYVLAASLPGFRPLKNEFDLRSARDWDRAVTLQVGELTETINVKERRVVNPGPTQPQPAQRIRVGGNIRVPKKETDVHPVYPATMREAGREGVVPIEAIIGVDGTVTSLRVLSAQVHPDFAIAATDAVRQWRFTPTLLNGKPVEVAMRVSITFSLAD
jgi:TonB family protein